MGWMRVNCFSLFLYSTALADQLLGDLRNVNISKDQHDFL